MPGVKVPVRVENGVPSMPVKVMVEPLAVKVPPVAMTSLPVVSAELLVVVSKTAVAEPMR